MITPGVATTAGRLIADATAELRESGSPTARLDAELLLAHVAGRDRAWALAHPEAEVDASAIQRFRAAVARRAAGEPVAYIRGYKEWLSLRIRTDARGLVPRPETEVLAEAAMNDIERRLATAAPDEPVVAWDVGTGSGAVIVAIARRFREAAAGGGLRLIATDLSPDALTLTAENLGAHEVADLVSLGAADLLAAADAALPAPHVVVANLPYLPSAEVDAAVGSLPHEPRLALDGGPDGLDLMRRFFAELPVRAAPGATILLEVAFGGADAVAALAPRGAAVERLRDLGGVERVLVIRLAT